MTHRANENQPLTDVDLARTLLADQLPHWRDLPLVPIEHFGTDHDVYRLGADMSLRLPRTEWAAAQSRKEEALLPRLAPHVTLALPQVLALGEPTAFYPFGWSVQSWLPGEDLVGRALDGDITLASDLASFVRSLRSVPTADAPPRPAGARGGDLGSRADAVVHSLDELGERVDRAAQQAAWAQTMQAAPALAECWTHGDLLPGNLLATDGVLTGSIDLGALNVADPALDLIPCWYLFGGVHSAASRRYLADLDADADALLRARGWAQLQALTALPYYWDTNPGMRQLAATALEHIAAEA